MTLRSLVSNIGIRFSYMTEHAIRSKISLFYCTLVKFSLKIFRTRGFRLQLLFTNQFPLAPEYLFGAF
jgi:hypothetical protein